MILNLVKRSMSDNDPSETAKALIDENLRKVFREHADEPLPDRFLSLLDQLRESQSKQDTGSSL